MPYKEAPLASAGTGEPNPEPDTTYEQDSTKPARSGLSSLHNGPPPIAEGWCSLTTYAGGEFAQLRMHGLAERRRGGGPPPGGRRGHVIGFSKASRRRLLQTLAKVNKLRARRLPLFVTLTYPAVWPADARVWKGHLRAFLKRLTRRLGALGIVWRLEYQKRGAPHFHLVLWDAPMPDGLRQWISRSWYEVVGSGDPKHLKAGTNTQRVESWRQLTGYLSKYVAKPDDDESADVSEAGRVWGVEHRDEMPTEAISWLVSMREGLAWRRAANRLRGHRRGVSGRVAGCNTFVRASTVARYVESVPDGPLAFDPTRGPPETWGCREFYQQLWTETTA